MKKLFCILTCVFVLVAICVMTASAETITGSCGDNVTYSLDTGSGLLTISGTGPMTDYSSPRNVPWYGLEDNVKTVKIGAGVTSIGDCAFYGCTSLTSITIPNSVTSIGYSAFYVCSSLTSITIPDSVKSIEGWAFSSCSRLTNIIIPNSVTSIGDTAFCRCSSLKSITIPDRITSIASGTFYYCSSLTSIIIPDSVKSIEGRAFSDCSSLKSIIIPESVTSIGSDAFSGCTSLESITIPDSITSIGDWVFYNCGSLKSITIPDSVTSIGNWVFYGCTSLRSISVTQDNPSYVSVNGVLFNKDKTSLIHYPIGNECIEYIIPDSVTSIRGAFGGCKSLASIIIPDSVTSIEGSAFGDCSSLTTITIPNSVTSIGDRAFYNCSSLKNVYFNGSESEWKGINFGSNNETLKAADLICLNIEYSNPSGGFVYPKYDADAFAALLEGYIKSSAYYEVFKPYLEEYTAKDLLEMSLNIPVVADDGTAYLVENEAKVKDLMIYILFAEETQKYFDEVNVKAFQYVNSGDNTEAFKCIYDAVQNFNVQYFNFQNDYNGKDTYNKTLQTLLLIKTALTVVDKANVSYVTDIYKATVSESPELYNDMTYYILSGGDPSQLSPEYQQTLKGYSLAIKDTEKLFKIATDPDYSVGADAGSLISLGFDNITYFANTYNLKGANGIKTAKNVWDTASKTYDIAKAISSGSLLGPFSAAYELSKAYYEQVMRIYDNAVSNDLYWYATVYYYFAKTNPTGFKQLVDPETGSASIDVLDGRIGFSYDSSDPVQKIIHSHWNRRMKYDYATTPGADIRLHLINICETIHRIQDMDCSEYRTMMLEYILAELNRNSGIMGVNFEVTAISSDSTLGSVQGSGSYPAGGNATVTAKCYSNVSFAGWTDNNTGELLSKDLTYNFPVYGAVSLNASFVAGEVETASAPIITTQPVSATYYAGQNASALTVSAKSTDGGSISVKWYKATTNTATGGTYVGSGTSYIPSTATKGTAYYYAVVTNTLRYTVGTETTTTTATRKTNSVAVTTTNPILQSINVTTPQNVTEYFYTDKFDTSGMVVTAHLSDGSSSVIDGYVVSYDFSNEGSSIVEVSYLNCSAEVTVTVVSQKSGTTENITWRLDASTKTMSLTGIGEMPQGMCDVLGMYSEYYSSVTIGTEVTSICSGAFAQNTNLTSITIPESVTTIEDDVLAECKNVTIYCYKYSVADTYAKANNIAVVYTGESVHTCVYDEGVVTLPPTCTENGNTVFTCQICGGTYSKNISCLGHTYGEWIITRPPQAGISGFKEQICTVCGSKNVVKIPSILNADIDGDGVVNVKDVLVTIKAVLNGTALDGADMNGDGKLSLIDVLLMLKAITA